LHGSTWQGSAANGQSLSFCLVKMTLGNLGHILLYDQDEDFILDILTDGQNRGAQPLHGSTWQGSAANGQSLSFCLVKMTLGNLGPILLYDQDEDFILDIKRYKDV
jgi:hypothetical protein